MVSWILFLDEVHAFIQRAGAPAAGSREHGRRDYWVELRDLMQQRHYRINLVSACLAASTNMTLDSGLRESHPAYAAGVEDALQEALGIVRSTCPFLSHGRHVSIASSTRTLGRRVPAGRSALGDHT